MSIYAYSSNRPGASVDPFGLLEWSAAVTAFWIPGVVIKGGKKAFKIAKFSWKWSFYCSDLDPKEHDAAAKRMAVIADTDVDATHDLPEDQESFKGLPFFAKGYYKANVEGSYNVESSQGSNCILVRVKATLKQHASAGFAKTIGLEADAVVGAIQYSATFRVCCYCTGVRKEDRGNGRFAWKSDYDYSILISKFKQDPSSKDWQGGHFEWGAGVDLNYAMLKKKDGKLTKVDMSDSEELKSWQENGPPPAVVK